MLQHAKIKFAFIGISQKINIIYNFEKRIKIRFSQRQNLFYSEELSTFQEFINNAIIKIKENSETIPQGEKFINELHRFITDERFG
jgi:hypothetical protein